MPSVIIIIIIINDTLARYLEPVVTECIQEKKWGVGFFRLSFPLRRRIYLPNRVTITVL